MDPSSPDYKQLFLQEKRLREEAERARARAEEKTRPTTLPEFLDACHTHLHGGLSVQTDSTLSTQGDPSNATAKVRPDRICLWEDFPAQQEAIWDVLVESDFIRERHFSSVLTLRENGEMVRRRTLGSELDLHHFERSTVHDPTELVVSRLHEKAAFRRAFALEGSVQFENHSNTLSPDEDLEQGMHRMSVAGDGRRRSPRLHAHEPPPAPAKRTPSARPRADQFCVYNVSGDAPGAGVRIPAFVIEYKPPHKLTLGHIYEGLDEAGLDLDEAVRCTDADGPKEKCRRLVAAAITQAFSYMVHAGLEFGCVCNGEASIFLRVPDDPRTVLYFLSVPRGDVGDATGWRAEGDRNNRLHLTAVGQMLAFTLQSLRKKPRSHAWRAKALEQLGTWEVVYEDLLKVIPAKEAPSSEYRPPRHGGFLRASPIYLRSRRPLPGSSCDPQDPVGLDDSNDEGSGPETPSRRARSMPSRPAMQPPPDASADPSTKRTASSRPAGQQQYCTQECLRGLIDGGALDKSCPNVHEHGRDRHQISGSEFCTLIRRQLAEDLDANFEPIGMPGSRGVPFRVRLASHGYTLAAKCTPPDFVAHLAHEAAVYARLRPIQGTHVPVHLGSIDLVQPYYYEGIAELTHAMFLSFGGTPVWRHEQLGAVDRTQLADQAVSCFHAIHALDVLHCDAKPRNILRNEKSGRVMVVDFERAELRVPQPVLGVISPNRKRRREESGLVKRRVNSDSAYAQERGLVAYELSTLVRPRSLQRRGSRPSEA